MEMSHDYMRETVEVMGRAGFAVEHSESAEPDPAQPVYERAEYHLRRGDAEDLVLECLTYPDGVETYWLELRKLHTLRSYSFELDSWKYRDESVEFRYYGREDGPALTLILTL